MKKYNLYVIIKKSFNELFVCRKGNEMNFKVFWDKISSLINDNKQNLVKLALSAIALMCLVIVLYFSSDNFNVGDEVNTFVTYIENRQYGMAESYYEGLEKEFSDSKINKFDKKASKKLSNILMNSADMYVNGELTKEKYMGLINILNSLKTIEIDSSSLIDLGKRVDQMYIEENITYDSASSYLQISSSLRGINQELDEYKQHIKTIYESREIYKNATKLQSVKKYHEAINEYDKVLEEDEKYYSLAENAKKESIKLMYDYYLEQGKYFAEEGKYEEALKYLSYLNPYYDNEKIDELEEEYNKYISHYTMTSDDIISLIARRSSESKKDLSVNSYLQTINGKRYYYGEVLKEDEVINEVLIDAKTKKIYSYKSQKKDYVSEYSDAYYYFDEISGQMKFSISKESAQSMLEKVFNENNKKYNSVKLLTVEEIEKYSNKDLEKMTKKNGNIYYYFSVKTGWFKPKEVFSIDMYNKIIYSIEDEVVKEYKV
ncbi:MAG: UbiD family decarboxylase [Terrisporobacter sp.]